MHGISVKTLVVVFVFVLKDTTEPAEHGNFFSVFDFVRDVCHRSLSIENPVLPPAENPNPMLVIGVRKDVFSKVTKEGSPELDRLKRLLGRIALMYDPYLMSSPLDAGKTSVLVQRVTAHLSTQNAPRPTDYFLMGTGIYKDRLSYTFKVNDVAYETQTFTHVKIAAFFDEIEKDMGNK